MMKLQLSLLALALGTLVTSADQAVAQKEEFLAEKCNRCHSVTAAGIEKKGAGEEEEEEEGEAPPDLSHVGKFHDAAFIQGFLEKKVEHAAHEGVQTTGKHKTKFKGSPEQLKQTSEWLASLK